MNSRSLAFKATSIWLMLAGAALLFPGVGNQLFALNLTNWGIASEYGGVCLGVGAMYWLFSRDPERYAPAMGLIALGLLLNVAVNVYWLAVGHYALQSAVFNIVINTALAGWLWALKPRSPAPYGAPTSI